MSNTIAMLQEVEESLKIVQDHTDMPAVICIAAQAGLLLVQKYHSMNDECEVYQIAIGNIYGHFCTLIWCPYTFYNYMSRQEVAMVCRPQLESSHHRRDKAAGDRSLDNILQTTGKCYCCHCSRNCCECSGHREFAFDFHRWFTNHFNQAGLSMETAPKTEVNTSTWQHWRLSSCAHDWRGWD